MIMSWTTAVSLVTQEISRDWRKPNLYNRIMILLTKINILIFKVPSTICNRRQSNFFFLFFFFTETSLVICVNCQSNR